MCSKTTQRGEGRREEEEEEEVVEEEEEQLVSRFIAVSRERLIVLDSHGKGVGAIATVKSNHHLTQLVKITFRRRDPNLVHLFFSTGLTAGSGASGGGDTPGNGGSTTSYA